MKIHLNDNYCCTKEMLGRWRVVEVKDTYWAVLPKEEGLYQILEKDTVWDIHMGRQVYRHDD